jgi:hypothetical protein
MVITLNIRNDRGGACLACARNVAAGWRGIQSTRRSDTRAIGIYMDLKQEKTIRRTVGFLFALGVTVMVLLRVLGL